MNESTWTDPTKEAQQTLNAAGAVSRDSGAGGTTPSQQKEQQRETAGLKTGVGEFVFLSIRSPRRHVDCVISQDMWHKQEKMAKEFRIEKVSVLIFLVGGSSVKISNNQTCSMQS